MKYISTNGKSKAVSFKEAVLKGQAPDGGLYFPRNLPRFPAKFFQSLHGKSFHEMSTELAAPFTIENLSKSDLAQIIRQAFSFNISLKKLEQNIYILELFHGPTLAFKDVGARFMAQCMSRFPKSGKRNTTILVATSGDTGSAVANGFLGVEGVDVIILFPRGKVSEIQEKQFTTLRHNITALKIDGNFDDCQRLVKTAFSDKELTTRLTLSSANSINIGRLLPQMFYYFYAWSQLKDPTANPIISVPSGNFGNLTAGLMARNMGLPVSGFIAATNINKVVPEYLDTGIFKPRPSVQTISNAMDVGNPSNLARIRTLYNDDLARMRKDISSISFTDEETRKTMREVFHNTGYLLDPHSAIGYAGLKSFLHEKDIPGITLATAHPVKFREVVEKETGIKPLIPERLKACLEKPSKTILMSKKFSQLKEFLLVNASTK